MLLVEHLGVALERHGCHEHASAAAGRLLGVPCEPRRVGADEEAGSTRGRGFPERARLQMMRDEPEHRMTDVVPVDRVYVQAIEQTCRRRDAPPGAGQHRAAP